MNVSIAVRAECGRAIFDEGIAGHGKSTRTNARLAENWINITEKTDALPDAEKYRDVDAKRDMLSENSA